MSRLKLDLCHLLQELPNITDREQFNDLYKYVQTEAQKGKDKVLLDWLRHKESNPWILKCVSPAVSGMGKDDWYMTSMNTNNAETMHAHSKRSGTHQTLVTVIQKSQQLDSTHFDRRDITIRKGISQKYGNTSALGRATKNLKRNTTAARKRKERNPESRQMNEILTKARDLVSAGIDPKVLEQFLVTEKSKLAQALEGTSKTS